MEEKILFVKTNDNHIVKVNRKNISYMPVLDVMNVHQHKDFSFISEERQNKNSFTNPLDARCIAGLTSAHVQLLDKSVDVSKDKVTFNDFWSGLNSDERAVLIEAATQVNSEKVISLIGSRLPADMQKLVISHIPFPSVVALKRAMLYKTSPTVSVLEGHERCNGGVAWNPDNSIVVSASFDPDLFILRNGQTGKPIKTVPKTYAKGIVFSPDGNRLVYNIEGGFYETTKAYLCDGHTGECIHSFVNNSSSPLVFSPDSQTLLAYNGAALPVFIFIYNAHNGDLVQKIEHSSPINNFAFAADSKSFISVGKGEKDKKCILWNTNGEKIKSLEGHDHNNVTHAVFSPDYSRLVTGSMCHDSKNNLILRDGKTGDIIRKITGHEREIGLLLFSPDNRYLFSGSYGNPQTLIIWNAKTGFCKNEIEKSVNLSADLIAFAQDNSFLIVDDTLYDTKTFYPITTLSILKELKPRYLALSPDGNRIAGRIDDALVLYTLFSQEALDLVNKIKSGTVDLFDACLYNRLCNKFGVEV